jgi:hypothetical protein
VRRLTGELRTKRRLLFATPTVGEAAVEGVGGAALAAPPRPHAAAVRVVSGITAALAREGDGLLGVMLIVPLGALTVAAICSDRIR